LKNVRFHNGSNNTNFSSAMEGTQEALTTELSSVPPLSLPSNSDPAEITQPTVNHNHNNYNLNININNNNNAAQQIGETVSGFDSPLQIDIVALSQDHKLERCEETERIKLEGGIVLPGINTLFDLI
jgi:hypothetical protein